MNQITELSFEEIQEVNGGNPLVAYAIGALYSSSSITAGGLATAFGLGAGFGAVVGGIYAYYY